MWTNKSRSEWNAGPQRSVVPHPSRRTQPMSGKAEEWARLERSQIDSDLIWTFFRHSCCFTFSSLWIWESRTKKLLLSESAFPWSGVATVSSPTHLCLDIDFKSWTAELPLGQGSSGVSSGTRSSEDVCSIMQLSMNSSQTRKTNVCSSFSLSQKTSFCSHPYTANWSSALQKVPETSVKQPRVSCSSSDGPTGVRLDDHLIHFNLCKEIEITLLLILDNLWSKRRKRKTLL